MSSDQLPSPELSMGTSPHEQDPSTVVRSDVWYDDGNIILQAEQVQFKVLRSILAEISSVFRDMFSLPQPTVAQYEAEMVYGCPIVHLSDSAEEVQLVLEAIFKRKLVILLLPKIHSHSH